METLYRFFSGAAAGLAALLAPAVPLAACAAAFIGIDFLTGVAADRKVTLKSGRAWYFESRRAWRTVLKAGFVSLSIVLTWLVESCVLDFLQLHLTRLFTGFVCGVELWSFLENAAVLSEAPLFRYLQRYVRRRVAKEAGDE